MSLVFSFIKAIEYEALPPKNIIARAVLSFQSRFEFEISLIAQNQIFEVLENNSLRYILLI